MLSRALTVYFLCVSISASGILLYSTEDNSMTDRFDCLYHTQQTMGEEIPYCQRPDAQMPLIRPSTRCENDGEKISFGCLLYDNIEPSKVLQWSSNMEMVDLYASVYCNRSIFDHHRDSWNTQRYGSIVCYQTLFCQSSPLCLDWREICDGVQRCSNGVDEENCDILEFNECEEDEFRCTNGMCIVKEFWFDGEFRLIS
jgi:hypothetical protein